MSDPVLPVLATPPPPRLAGSVRHPRLTALVEVLLCSGVPTQFAIFGLLALAGWVTRDSRPDLPVLLTVLLADTVVVIALMVALMRSHGERPGALWLGSRAAGSEALVGLALVLPLFLMVVALLGTLRLAAPWLHNVPVNPLETMAGTSATHAALFGVAAMVAGGLREELQRAFLLRRFEQHLGGRAVGVAVLSVAFGLGHIDQGWDAVITTGVLGAFWAVLYLRRGSIVAPVVSHAGFNGVEVLRVAVLGT